MQYVLLGERAPSAMCIETKLCNCMQNEEWRVSGSYYTCPCGITLGVEVKWWGWAEDQLQIPVWFVPQSFYDVSTECHWYAFDAFLSGCIWTFNTRWSLIFLVIRGKISAESDLQQTTSSGGDQQQHNTFLVLKLENVKTTTLPLKGVQPSWDEEFLL